MTILAPGATYLPPGVYIQEDSTPIVSVLGLAPATIGLIGPSVGYRTTTDVIQLTGTTPVQLSQLGINQSTIVVAALNGAPYVETTDYILTVGGGADGNVATTQDNTTTVQRSSGSNVSDGGTVQVTYEFTDLDYTAPFRASSFADVARYLGPPLDATTGAILSPLCLAAMVAYQNSGGGDMVVIPTPTADTATRADISNAYTQLEALPEVDLVVPLPKGITGTDTSPGDTENLAADLSNFITADVNANSIYRFGVLGLDQGATINHATIASQARNKRTAVAWPNQLSFYNGFSRSTITLDGFYLAAAYAGLLAGQPVENGLTKKTVQGFLDIPASLKNLMTMTYKNQLSQAGVVVAEMRHNNFTQATNMVVRHGVSTDNSSIDKREISVTRAQDALIQSMQATLDSANFIGNPIGPNTLVAIKGVAMTVLETAKVNSIIYDYQTPQVQQSSVDPTVVNVKFSYIPMFPLDYIEVTFSVNTQTGSSVISPATPSGNPTQ